MVIDEQYNVRRYVSEFCNNSDELLAKYELESFNLAAFQGAFGVDSANPMFECYSITQEHLSFLSPYLAQEIYWDFKAKSYFVEADTV